jgi:hypothetical protein
MLRELLDSLGEDGYLYVCGACVGRVEPVAIDYDLPLVLGEHRPPKSMVGALVLYLSSFAASIT